MIAFVGTMRDLEQLDALNASYWGAWSLDPQPEMTFVDSNGRTHLWPGNLDKVSTALTVNGYRFRIVEAKDETEVTRLVVVGKGAR